MELTKEQSVARLAQEIRSRLNPSTPRPEPSVSISEESARLAPLLGITRGEVIALATSIASGNCELCGAQQSTRHEDWCG